MNLLKEIVCPFCKSTNTTILKSWNYGTYGAIKVFNMQCKCGKNFKYYRSKKNTWTIPKKK